MGYTVILEREADDGNVVTVPALPGCVTQGDTREEALRNVREAIELYIEDCRKAGDPVSQEERRE
jgi:predicted RNase H-like HicB family nuclease